jgi:hypothetical protein
MTAEANTATPGSAEVYDGVRNSEARADLDQKYTRYSEMRNRLRTPNATFTPNEALEYGSLQDEFNSPVNYSDDRLNPQDRAHMRARRGMMLGAALINIGKTFSSKKDSPNLKMRQFTLGELYDLNQSTTNRNRNYDRVGRVEQVAEPTVEANMTTFKEYMNLMTSQNGLTQQEVSRLNVLHKTFAKPYSLHKDPDRSSKDALTVHARAARNIFAFVVHTPTLPVEIMYNGTRTMTLSNLPYKNMNAVPYKPRITNMDIYSRRYQSEVTP